MKPRAVRLHVSDHAVLRYLEREHGLDIDAVRSHLRGVALGAAELGAVAVGVERVRLVLREFPAPPGVAPLVCVATAVPRIPPGINTMPRRGRRRPVPDERD